VVYPGWGFPIRGGFMVKLNGVDQPIPIGSLGDGAWRMLALAIALSRSKDSLLLIDEIDTGLHYTVMADMWKLVADTAKDLNVQVFATTHSSDCIRSLATICHDDVRVNSQVSIQRLEPEHDRAVPYTEAEIKVAAERNIEMR
jgi:AAA15 family ATPase/GTPase